MRVHRPRIRVVLVGIEGSINLGMVARLCRNFDVDELYLVDPKASINEEAYSFAAGGREYLEKAIIVNRLEEALLGSDLVVCTSSIVREKSDPLRQPMELEQFLEVLEGKNLVSIVFGRESTGLTRKELELCNIYLHIMASAAYPTLNLSHAVAITLYSIFKKLSSRSSIDVVEYPSSEDYKVALKYIKEASELTMNDERQRISAIKSLERIIYKSNPTKMELSYFILLLRRLLKKYMIQEEGVRSADRP
ncbi:MAG: TrmH family RNA methyltransferase [Sulfolobales archaeon]